MPITHRHSLWTRSPGIGMSMKEAPSLAMAGKALGGQTSRARGGVNMGPNGKRPAILWGGSDTYLHFAAQVQELGVQIPEEWSCVRPRKVLNLGPGITHQGKDLFSAPGCSVCLRVTRWTWGRPFCSSSMFSSVQWDCRNSDTRIHLTTFF